MAMARVTEKLTLTEAEEAQLASFARSRSLPASLSLRAKIVLASASGGSSYAVARQLNCNHTTAGKWRRRFLKDRIAGLYDELRPGKPRTIDDERVAMLIKQTLEKRPKNGATHWSVRAAAAESGISKSSVQRYFQLFGIKPHRTKSFKLSNDALFIEKLRAVVGLYLNPPENALVLCVDEKSQCQALERTQPMLPLGLG
jgi:putative transposase